MSLVLENASFSQELNDVFQQPTETLSFEATKKRRNSKRTRKPAAIKAAERSVKRAAANLKKRKTRLRVVRNRHK